MIALAACFPLGDNVWCEMSLGGDAMWPVTWIPKRAVACCTMCSSSN
jgi:hypothetical protein